MFDEIFGIVFRPITERLDKLMATVEQLQSQIREARDSLQAAIDRVEDDVNALRDKVEAGIDPSELDPISQGLANLKAATDSLDPDPENPPPPTQ